MTTPRRLRELYESGANVAAWLREEQGSDANTGEIIELAYDLQSGSYIDLLADEDMARINHLYAAEAAKLMLEQGRPRSILEAGVGEATTLCAVLKALGEPRPEAFGFDLSWSRTACARRWLDHNALGDAVVCTGELEAMPFADDSVEIVYTSHSIEPNGGREESILRELLRVTGRLLMLLEPAYELAHPEARERMESHGYCRDLADIARSLGGRVVRHELFPVSANPLNPTALILIEKRATFEPKAHVLACPRYRTRLDERGGALWSEEALAIYPIIAGIPCLRPENAVLASKFPEIVSP